MWLVVVVWFLDVPHGSNRARRAAFPRVFVMACFGLDKGADNDKDKGDQDNEMFTRSSTG